MTNKPSALFFLASDTGSTEAEGNAITLLKITHRVTVVTPSMGSVQSYFIDADFVAAMRRDLIPAEAKSALARIFD